MLVVYYLFLICSMVILNMNYKFLNVNSDKLNLIQNQINKNKNKKRFKFDEQKNYLELLGKKEDELFKTKIFGIFCILFTIINILVFKGFNVLYLNIFNLQIKVGFIFTIIFVILFAWLCSWIFK